MKKVIASILAIGCLHLFAQKMTYTGIILVDSLPEELLPPGVTELGFITANENNQPVGFGYEISELNYKIIAKLGKEYDDFKGVDLKAYYRNDTIFFWSHIKYKDVQTFNYYSWDSKTLELLESVTSDPSQEATRDGEDALRKGEIREASEFYNKVKYVPAITLAKTAFNILGVAHILATDASIQGNYKEAVQLMDGAFVYHLNDSMLKSPDEFAFHKIVMGNFDQKQADSLGPWITNYAYFLYKCDSFERSLAIADFVLMCFPKMPEAYLIKADALYDLKREEESLPVYDKYMGLMVNRGTQALVPPRVSERLSKKNEKKQDD